MARARSPRAALRGLGFDKDKIKAFSKAARLARQYFNGGKPGPEIERSEDDPNYQAGWNFNQQDLSHHTGIPIATVSEMENHASYTLGLDSVASMTRFLYRNSKNGELLKPFLGIGYCTESLLRVSDEIVSRNKAAGFVPISEPLKGDDPLCSSRQSVIDTETSIHSPVSQEFIAAVEFLLQDWGRLTESGVQTAIKASKFPVEELGELKSKLAISKPETESAQNEDNEVRHADYDYFWRVIDSYLERVIDSYLESSSKGRRPSRKTLVKRVSDRLGVSEDLVEILVFSDSPGHPAYEDPISMLKEQWTVSDYKKLLVELKDPDTQEPLTLGELSTALGIDLSKRSSKKKADANGV